MLQGGPFRIFIHIHYSNHFYFLLLLIDSCVDTDKGTGDYGGMGCSWYDDDVELYGTESCGIYDDDDFKANKMCCACGGGNSTAPGI